MATPIKDQSKLEVRAAVRFLFSKGIRPSEINKQIPETYGEGVKSRSRVYQWCTWFGEGRTSLGDELKSGHPKSSTNEENTTRVDELIKCGRRMKISEIALKLKIPKNNGDEDTTHIGVGLGGNFRAKNSLFDNLITGDETFVHLDTPETKRESMTWKHPSSPVTKNLKMQRSAVKVMATDRVLGCERCGPLSHLATGSVYQCCPILQHP
ncbi:histone-lysine N-methyltransferase SETMAR [Elysia marginata]|uniref:Histone-lysine N-methyltransferase SETMAR n=1 Tax=Elysia marginata TaxID=1093978 RepID=A0AAV4JX93_9GAST|nr:histone-lysine N-methyltransferase SETMAR [Elysia marginata]